MFLRSIKRREIDAMTRNEIDAMNQKMKRREIDALNQKMKRRGLDALTRSGIAALTRSEDVEMDLSFPLF